MEDNTVITTEKACTSSQLNSLCRVICRVCQKQFSQYTCPRCNTRYCSLQCYKSHSIRCSESFMRENVMEELRLLRPDDETKKKMLDILKRFHSQEEDSMDEDEPSLSEETIQKVVSGAHLNYEDLTAEERKLFHRALASGELSKMIEPWDPWWLKPSARMISLSRDGTQVVQPLGNQETLRSYDDSESNLTAEIPAGPEAPLLPTSELTSTEPSPLLAIHLIDILYSYCFTLRFYNGDWQSDAMGAATVVLSVSSVLAHGRLPETVLEAIAHCLEMTCSPAFKSMGGLQFGFSLLDDVISLLSLGGAALVCALCDLRRLIQAAELELKLKKQRKVKGFDITGKLKSAVRKIYFVMCWAFEQQGQVWSSLAALVKAEKALELEHQTSKGRMSNTVRSSKNKTKALVEEVP
ncbi:hypothetical protein Nepgr_024472 [Nepenthes gracilis]|uniref:HIT-type domain-containing protein n=1 Tax=Nepenthes gracilis TaxID=150966 RepID=A0AAD3T4Q1_NEPGR|nr:hypothetical protein Nepgr_024472 [Nepenthes gracilis]